MKILFYSNNCNISKKILIIIDKNNIASFFKLINCDIEKYPKEINIIPTVIDDELNQPIKGNLIFDYINNIQYFNNPTNNIDYIIPINPNIPSDEKANTTNINNLEIKPEIEIKTNKVVNNKLFLLKKLKK